MSTFKKILKWILGILGSLVMLVGFAIFFFGLVLSNMVSNIDSFDEMTKTSVSRFVEENRQEVREFVEESIIQNLGPMDFVDKDTLKILCSAPESMFVDGDGSMEFQEVLTDDVCSDLESKTDEEVRNTVIDALIDNQIDSVLQIVQQTEEVKQAMGGMQESYDSVKNYIYGGSIFLYLLGAFLVFWSTGFKWKKTLYSVSLQTAIKLLTVAGVFYYIMIMKAETILSLMEGLKENFAEVAAATEIPQIIVKLAAVVMLDWVRMATNPLITLSLIAAVPFIAIVVVLLIVRNKERKKHNSKELKDEVV